MSITASQKRLILAILASTAIIATALMLRADDTSVKNSTNTAANNDIVVTTASNRMSIPIADSNNDGVPDWQEALQQTEAIEVSGTPDENFLPPDTLTDQFALEFFEQMVRNENYGEFGTSPDVMVAEFSNSLAREVVDTVIGREGIIITNDNSPAALERYGESIALIILTNSDTLGENEAVILERALRDQNEAELQKLDIKKAVYIKLLKQSLQVPVPSTVATEHLLLINALQALLADITAMRNAFTDPMLTLLRMKRYQDDAAGLYIAITTLFTVLSDSGATWQANSPVFKLISFIP